MADWTKEIDLGAYGKSNRNRGGIGVVLSLSGGLTSLQAGAIASGLPLASALLLMCVGTFRILRL